MFLELFSIGATLFNNWNGKRQELNIIKETHKKEIIELDHQIKVASKKSEIKRAEDKQEQNYNLDIQTTKDMKTTLKDEFILYVFYAPLLFSFFGFHNQVLEGFKALEEMPEWYGLIVILLAVTISGMRGTFIDALKAISIIFKKEK